MRILGQETSPCKTVVVQLPRSAGNGPLLQLSPLPLGFQRRLREHRVTPPAPPTRIARDAQSRPIRQPNGQALIIADEQDESYLAEREVYHQRVAVLSVAEALRNDPAVTFESRASDFPEDWRPFADRLYAELEAAEWSAGDLLWLCDQICRLSNLLDSHLETTSADFSLAAGSANRSRSE